MNRCFFRRIGEHLFYILFQRIVVGDVMSFDQIPEDHDIKIGFENIRPDRGCLSNGFRVASLVHVFLKLCSQQCFLLSSMLFFRIITLMDEVFSEGERKQFLADGSASQCCCYFFTEQPCITAGNIDTKVS